MTKPKNQNRTFHLLQKADILTCYEQSQKFTKVPNHARITPAMAAGLSDHVWGLEEIVRMADNYLPKPGKRSPYKNRIA